MALNDDTQIKFHLMSQDSKSIGRDNHVEYEVDSFDFGDRFDMDFDTGF